MSPAALIFLGLGLVGAVAIWSAAGAKVKDSARPAALGNSQLVGLQPSSLLNGSLGGGDNTIVAGSALLPDAGPIGTLADIRDTPPSDLVSIYVVRPGDSLSEIAQMFGVSVHTIIWANDLPAKGVIREGQTLLILPISGVRHTVAAGETVESIAKKYQGDLREILQFNGLSADGRLTPGEIIIIPDGELPQAVSRLSPRPSGGRPPSYDGYYLRPVASGVKTQGRHGYNGIDLGAAAGTPILAAADGQVLISRRGGWNGGYGNYVVIEHPNKTQTLYAHNQENIVAGGQWVVKGQVIGYVGSTGRSSGSHLHFEVRGAQNPF